MSFAVLYGNGAVMGFTPEKVGRMTMWEFDCAFTAWKQFNGVKSKSGEHTATIERLRELGIE